MVILNICNAYTIVHMTEHTKLVSANTITSLRTTVPMFLVRHFGLKVGDSISWDLESREGEFVVIIRPAKELPA